MVIVRWGRGLQVPIMDVCNMGKGVLYLRVMRCTPSYAVGHTWATWCQAASSLTLERWDQLASSWYCLCHKVINQAKYLIDVSFTFYWVHICTTERTFWTCHFHSFVQEIEIFIKEKGHFLCSKAVQFVTTFNNIACIISFCVLNSSKIFQTRIMYLNIEHPLITKCGWMRFTCNK